MAAKRSPPPDTTGDTIHATATQLRDHTSLLLDASMLGKAVIVERHGRVFWRLVVTEAPAGREGP